MISGSTTSKPDSMIIGAIARYACQLPTTPWAMASGKNLGIHLRRTVRNGSLSLYPCAPYSNPVAGDNTPRPRDHLPHKEVDNGIVLVGDRDILAHTGLHCREIVVMSVLIRD